MEVAATDRQFPATKYASVISTIGAKSICAHDRLPLSKGQGFGGVMGHLHARMLRHVAFRCLMLFGVVVLTVSCDRQATADGEPAAVVGEPGTAVGEVKVPLLGRIHFNVQVTDFAESLAFYRMLGLTEGRTGFNKTNTHEMARALGMFDLCTYEFYDAEVAHIPSSWGPSSIDIIQYVTPFNDEPPYSSVNHLGMAYAGLLTTNLAADYAYLKSQGVRFLSEPYGIPGNRFVFLQDPDGTFYQLYESAPPHGDPQADTHIKAIPFVAFNVSDFEQSRAFYYMLGFTESKPLPDTSTLAEAQAYGFDKPFRIRGADLSMTTAAIWVSIVSRWGSRIWMRRSRCSRQTVMNSYLISPRVALVRGLMRWE
jgi:catechol 2,3-dioxygenase-like lactoylglutathione lyase family enzyme